MKIKMREYFQGTNVAGVFVPGQVYDVDEELAAYLLGARKAEQVEEVRVVEASNPEPVVEAEPQPEPEQVEPVEEAPKRRRGRR